MLGPSCQRRSWSQWWLRCSRWHACADSKETAGWTRGQLHADGLLEALLGILPNEGLLANCQRSGWDWFVTWHCCVCQLRTSDSILIDPDRLFEFNVNSKFISAETQLTPQSVLLVGAHRAWAICFQSRHGFDCFHDFRLPFCRTEAYNVSRFFFSPIKALSVTAVILSITPMWNREFTRLSLGSWRRKDWQPHSGVHPFEAMQIM